MQYVEVVVVGLSVCIAIVWRQDVAVVLVRRSSSSLEALVESRQGVHSRSSRRRGESWQQPVVVAVVSRQGLAVVVESRQGVAVLPVVADVAVVSGVSGSSCSKCCISF